MSTTSNVQTYTLLDGRNLPWLGWGAGDAFGEQILKAGVRHIDTAQGYGTEGDTGTVVANSGLPKDEIFVTTKVSQVDDKPIPHSQLIPSIEESTRKLGFVPDLLLIHNPFVAEDQGSELKKMWQTLENLKDEGKLKSIGVSNFRPQDLELLLNGARHVPAVNQLEFHPYVLAHLEPLLALQEKHGIRTAAYGPLKPLTTHPTGGGPIKPVLETIATRLAKSQDPAVAELVKDDPLNAVLLLWLHERGVIAVTGTKNVQRAQGLARLARAKTGVLTKEEVAEIERVGKTVHWRHYREHMEQDFPVPNLPDGTA